MKQIRPPSLIAPPLAILLVFITTGSIGGCSKRTNKLILISYKDIDNPKKVVESFEKAFWEKSKDNLYTILLSSKNNVPTKDKEITQIAIIKLFWQPIPGKTFANSSQINAQIEYIVVLKPLDKKNIEYKTRRIFKYRGSGFVFIKSYTNTTINGTIEEAILYPQNKTEDPLGRFILSGSFTAKNDPASIGKMLFELENLN